MNIPPLPKKVRVSVPVTLEVLERFQRYSRAAGQSVGRAMSEWLEGTQEGLEPMIDILEKHKRVPFQAVRALQSYSVALDNSTKELFEKVRQMDGTAETLQAAAAAARVAQPAIKRALTPPSSNTGGKVLRTHINNKTKK